VFASPVALQLVHLAAHVGFDCLVLDPEHDLDGAATVRTAEQAGLDDRTDVVVTDHDRPELGDVLAAVPRAPDALGGRHGQPRHTAPHVAGPAERGVAPEVVAACTGRSASTSARSRRPRSPSRRGRAARRPRGPAGGVYTA
jgi:hypothetical protein